MVAYSFKKQFVSPIATRIKRQTVRGPRNRHARPGEQMQLYSGMRTKYCRKIIDDPICLAVDEVWMRINRSSQDLVEAISVNSIPLSSAEIEAFAVADGFGSDLTVGFARRRMGQFWVENHLGDYLGMEFEGVLLRWGWDA